MFNSRTPHKGPPEKDALAQISTRMRLPSLPKVYTGVMDMCTDDCASLDEISTYIRYDPALTLGVLSLAGACGDANNAGLPPLKQAVAYIGKDNISDLAAFNAFETSFNPSGNTPKNIDAFWLHSVRCAIIAELLSRETNYHDHEEAFRAGLLHDIGKLVLAICFPIKYGQVFLHHTNGPAAIGTERSQVGTDHCRAGAWVVQQHTGPTIIADAVLYHHETPEKIASAFPLVSVVYVADYLSKTDAFGQEKKYETVQSLTGLDVNRIEELVAHGALKTEEILLELGIKEADNRIPEKRRDDNPEYLYPPLAVHLKDTALASAFSRNLLKAKNSSELFHYTAQRLKMLFGTKEVYFFIYDSNRKSLVAQPVETRKGSTAMAGLVIPLKLHSCLPVFTMVHNQVIDSFNCPEGIEPSLVDTQMLHLTQTDGLLCVPLATEQKGVGTMIIGINRHQYPDLKRKMQLLQSIARCLTEALNASRIGQNNTISQNPVETVSRQTIRKAVHEINNPLGAVKNYLKVLEIKLQQKDIVIDEIGIIKDEISRVVKILNHLAGKTRNSSSRKKRVDPNAVLRDIISLLRASLGQATGIEIHLDLDDNIPPSVLDPDILTQVITNLINNAVEALGEEGNIHVETRLAGNNLPSKDKNDKKNVTPKSFRLVISDDGPGVGEDIRQTLFEPHVTSKPKHQGLGLSIVKELVNQLSGTIACDNRRTRGARFTVELPLIC